MSAKWNQTLDDDSGIMVCAGPLGARFAFVVSGDKSAFVLTKSLTAQIPIEDAHAHQRFKGGGKIKKPTRPTIYKQVKSTQKPFKASVEIAFQNSRTVARFEQNNRRVKLRAEARFNAAISQLKRKERTMEQAPWSRTARALSSAFLTLMAMAGCSGETVTDTLPSSDAETQEAGPEASEAMPEWDGQKLRETDAIITLNLSDPATLVLLNGEPARAMFDNKAKSARVLIPSDDSGISCSNTFIVSFGSGEKGQLAANHCHGADTFDVNAGEITNALLTKEDVDNPLDDLPARANRADGTIEDTPLSFEWSANGFEQLPSQYIWGGGKDDSGGAFAQLGVPETDDLVFSASCDGGGVLSYILLYDREPKKGMWENFMVEVEGQPARSYEVYGLEYGEGVAFSLRLPSDDPIFAEMASGQWAYWQMGSDSGRGKIRVSLKGARGPMRDLMERC